MSMKYHARLAEIVEKHPRLARVLFVTSYGHHMEEEKSTYLNWKYVEDGKG
jgi:hypothetical protein